MTRLLACAALALCVLVPSSARMSAQTYFGTVLTPPVGHPRLLMTISGVSPTVSELQARLGTGGAQATLFQSFLGVFCQTIANGGIFDGTPGDDEHAIWIYAFLYVTYPVAGANYFSCVDQSGILTRLLTSFDAVVAGSDLTSRGATTVAVAYDWAFTGLSLTRKQAAINFMQAATPDPGTVNLWGHSDTASRGRLAYTWAGYVWAGDGIEDGDATTRINAWSTYYESVTGVHTASILTTSPSSGSYVEGLGYWMSEWQQSIGWIHWIAAESYRTSQGATNTYAPGQNTMFEYFPTYFAWQLTPYYPNDSSGCGICLRLIKTPESDDRGTDVSFPDTSQQYMSLFPAFIRAYASTNPTQAGLGKWLYTNLFFASGYVPQTAGTTTYRWALIANYFGYNTVTATSPASMNLPLTKQFTQGYVIVKDNWLFDGTSSWVRLIAEPYDWGAPLGYGQPCTGGFDIHRRGPLAIEPGAGAHSIIQETGWGCNTVIFPKPAETRSGRFYWDKGGMRPQPNFSTVSSTALLTTGSQWDIGGLKSNTSRVDLSPGTHSSPSTTHAYSYVYVDLSRAYNGTQNIDSENSSKISNYERQVARFPSTTPGVTPGFTVVYDRTTTTGTDVEPRWLLWPAANTTNTIKTMTITGATSTDTVTRNGVASPRYIGTCGTMTGTIAYTGVWSMSAKAFWTPLLPASCYIIERGGPNAMGQLGQTDSHDQEDPYGYQGGCWQSETAGSCGALSSSGARPYEGSYRYELLYQTTATVEPFLNVVEDVEYATVSATAKTLLTGTNTSGVRIDAAAPRCAIFKTTTGTLTTGTFVLAVTGTFDCLIADLPTSTPVTFTIGSNITSLTNIADGDPDLTYTTTAQGTLWLRAVVTSAGGGANNTVSW